METSSRSRATLALATQAEEDLGVHAPRHVVKVGAPDLLEREESLRSLTAALADVAGRRTGSLVLVHGEAGIGKTSVTRRFCETANSSPRVLWATCDPLFTPRPLGPLFDIARVVGGELREQIEAGGQPHDVAAALIDELDGRTPSIVVVEDLHWADEATLDVLRLCARRIDGVPVLLIASYRDEGLPLSHPLRVMLGGLPGASRVELARLSSDAVTALARSAEMDAAELYERTGGNPFYVSEVIAGGSRRIPATVRDAVLARAAALSGAARDVLEAVAVIPQRTEVWLLEALVQRALDGLDECLDSGMLRGELNGVAFRHELARLAIEESLTPHRAVVLHRRALEALTHPALGAPDLARLAHHAEAAGDADAVLRYSPAAAEQAAAVGAHREALHQYALALRFSAGLPPERRAELLERLADEGFLTDMREESLAALDEALEIHRGTGELVRAGDVLRLRARVKSDIGRTAEARIDLREATEILEGRTPGIELARTYAENSCLALQAGDEEQTLAWANRAIELAERLGGDTDTLAHALNNIGTIELGHRGDIAGREKLERSLEVARSAGELRYVAMVYINLSYALSRIGFKSEAASWAAKGVEYCEQQGLDAWKIWLLGHLAESTFTLGQWDEAADAAAVILAAPAPPKSASHSASLILALMRARRGDPDYRAPLEQARSIAVAVGDLQYLAPVAAAEAECAWLAGRAAEIGPATQSVYELALEKGAADWVGELGLWRRRGGLPEAPMADAAEPFACQLAGDWEHAARLWRERGCPYEAALALADSDDPTALREALEELQALGGRPAAAIVARRLRKLGERGLPRGPRPKTRANSAGLTARELEVLALLGEGMRNAQIADRLVLSGKTVDHHVSAILRKLDARSRGEAVAQASRLGLLAP